MTNALRLFIAGIAILLLSYSGRGQENILENGGFESSRKGMPDNWILVSPTTDEIKKLGIRKRMGGTVNCEDIANSKKCVFLKSPVDASGQQKPVAISSGELENIEPGSKYELEFFAKADNAEEQKLKVIFYTGYREGRKHWYKIKEFTIGSSWARYSFSERIPEKAEWGDRKLEVRFAVPMGAAFIDEASLTLSEKKKFNIKRVNILENPGFDGCVSGWFICQYVSRREPDLRTMEFDKKIRHDGTASLKLPGLGMTVRSRRYEFKPDTKYTLSFYVRGEEKVTGSGVNFFMHDPHYKNVVKRKIRATELNDKWKRFSMEFESPSLGEPYANSLVIRIDPHSTVWVDSMQLQEGEISDYSPGAQIGINFENNGVYHKGKEGSINLVASVPENTKESLAVALKCVDIYGNTVLHKSRILQEGESMQNISVPVNFERAGVLNVKALLGGKELGVLAEAEWRLLVIDGPVAPELNPLLGVDVCIGQWPQTYTKENISLEKMLGTGFNRSFYRTNSIQSSKIFPQDDKLILEAKKTNYTEEKSRGSYVVFTVNPDVDSPLNLVLRRRDKQMKVTEKEIDDAIKLMASQFANIARELDGVADLLEIFNEPNIWRVNGKNIMPPELYVRIIKVLYPAIKAANPKMRVAANTNGIDFFYIQKLLELGVADYIDDLTVHPYRTDAESPPVLDDYKKLRTMLDKYKPEIRIINGEQYYGARDLQCNGEFNRSYCGRNFEDTSGRILQTALHGIVADMVPFSLHSGGFYRGITASPYFCYTFGTYRALGVVLQGTVAAEEIELSKELRVFLFSLKDGSKVVSVNTRDLQTKIRFELSANYSHILDAEGNPLSRGAVSAGYLPTYFVYDKYTDLEELRRQIGNAIFSSGGLPVTVSLIRTQDGKLQMDLVNTAKKNVVGRLKITESPVGWTIPDSIDFKLKSHGRDAMTFESDGRTVEENQTRLLSFTADLDGILVNRSIKAPSFTVPFAAGKPLLDGSLSGWENAVFINMNEGMLSRNFNARESHRGPNDLSAVMRFMWSEEGLYVGLKIKDDKLFFGKATAQLHDFDSIQIYFDPQNDASRGDGFGAGDFAYTVGMTTDEGCVAWVNRSSGNRFVGANNATTGLDAEVKCACQKTDSGYNLEMFFPASALPGVNLSENGLLGLAVLVNDNDGTGRKQGLTLGPKLSEPYDKPFIWPCVQLVK